MRYRKIPLEVDAKQWFPPGDHRHDSNMLSDRLDESGCRLIGDLYCAIPEGRFGFGGNGLYFLKTLSGNIKINPGDWIVNDNCKLVVYRESQFTQIFEKAI